jgi:hypothetical protein
MNFQPSIAWVQRSDASTSTLNFEGDTGCFSLRLPTKAAKDMAAAFEAALKGERK